MERIRMDSDIPRKEITYAIVGSRKFDNYVLLTSVLDNIIVDPSKVRIISGGASGADILAKEYAKKNGAFFDEFPADWQDMSEPCIRKRNKKGVYNALAGIKRNETMAQEADMIIAFWNGWSKGTKNMIEQGTKFKKNTLIIYY